MAPRAGRSVAMTADFIHIAMLFLLIFGFIVIVLCRFMLIWLSRKSGDDRFCEIASLDYMVPNTPGEASRALKAYMSAYRAAPRSAIGVIAIANVILWFVMFTPMLIYAITEVVFMIFDTFG